MNTETPIIKKLKRRFIALAMGALVVMLAVIVAGMNIINYEKVLSDADARLDVIEQNSMRFLGFGGGFNPFADIDGGGEMSGRKDLDDWDDMDDIDDYFFGRKGAGGPSMTRDEAEESRFFTVIMSSDGTCKQTNIARISAVDANDAEDYAKTAMAENRECGFVDDFRYSVTTTSTGTRITFLDCGRTLESYRSFLRASILMSLAGLLILFAVIVFFAGRIVRPVAESYEKQKRFITDAGHEMKTPLAIIKANLDVIKMDPDSTEESLDDIGDQVDRLTGLTEDLVYLSRMEEAETSLVMTEVPLSDIVGETVSSFEALAKEKGKTIETDIEPMLSIEGSNKELEKLVSILMENAVKYSSEEEPVRVSLRRDGKNSVLEVSNKTYSEVTNESLSHVFERFYRTDESRSSTTGGHGIGLSMASAIVNAHKGRISAHTTDGSDFIVTVIL